MSQPATRIISHISLEGSTESAFRQVRSSLKAQLQAQGIGKVDLAVVFATTQHGEDGVAEISAQLTALRKDLGHPALIGCLGESVIGADQEIEQGPALSAWCASLPGETIAPVRMQFGSVSEEEYAFTGWPDGVPSESEKPALILVADPHSFPADELLRQTNERSPWLPIIGGMASGASSPGEARLFLNDAIHVDGAVGVLLHGPIELRTVVSQGCRPIGRPFVITKAEDNVIHELGGKPALAQVSEMIGTLPPADKRLVRHSLHVGRAIRENKESFGRGDFLIRNVMGFDQESGTIAISDYVRRGQTIQFHVRDASSADEDLHMLLANERSGLGKEAVSAAGALVFSCNGRGQRLFPAPNHDVGVVREEIGTIPIAGFFAAGEIGPVGGKNFLHGFTASIALFCEKAAAG